MPNDSNNTSLPGIFEAYSVDASQRKLLIDGHLGKVALMAKMLAARLPSRFDWEDMAQEGVIAMIQASERFDAQKGEFWQFVYRHVRGAMLDFLGANCREMCHVELSQVRVLAPDRTATLARELDIERAMKKLTSQELRVVTALRRGHRPRRIAGMLNVNESTVSRLRKRAIKRLRSRLAA